MADTGRRGWRAGGSLTRRAVAVSVLLSTVIGGAFFLLALAVDALRDSESRANHALEVQVAASRVERSMVEIEASQRGFLITGNSGFLQPWHRYQAEFTQNAAALARLAASGDAGQGRGAQQIADAGRLYIRDYSVPLVATAERDLDSARTVAVTQAGQRMLADLQSRFQHFQTREHQIFMARQARADSAASSALGVALVSVAGSIVLIFASGGYLIRSVAQPVRRAAAMAGTVANGDLTVRLPETGPAEVGRLEASFNTMTDSLVRSGDELHRVAREQAALRRVATLVAGEVSPSEVFGAVAAETGAVLGAASTAVARFEQDGTATVVGCWDGQGGQGTAMQLASHWPTEEDNVAGLVRHFGQPAWVSGGMTGAAASVGEHAIRCGVGSPILVAGRLWGAVTAFFGTTPQSDDAERRLLAFTDLVAMAIANAENRAQLAASRARIVAAADETRRRIERDLHDGPQQRLISLALELRAAAARMPPEQRSLIPDWSRTTQGLTDAVEELRVISQGLHPVILEKGGLRPALRALARRSAVPVELNVGVPGRLPEAVEVAAYYVVSEALTNVAKHARASAVEVDVATTDDVVWLRVRDDGVGGADASRGSGLVGLSDRVEAIGGRVEISSQSGRGTTLFATIPRRPGVSTELHKTSTTPAVDLHP
jgi:signal transduction histidine kinase